MSLDIASLNADTVAILLDIARTDFITNNARLRVYPRTAGAVLTLTPPASADTFSAWTALIPINTVTIDYMVAGIIFETWGGKDTFLVQLASSATPADDDYICEIRLSTPIADDWQSTNLALVKTGKINANGGVWGRIQAATTNAYAMNLSLVIQHHKALATAITLSESWPW